MKLRPLGIQLSNVASRPRGPALPITLIDLHFGQSNEMAFGTTGIDVPAAMQAAMTNVKIYNKFNNTLDTYQAAVNSEVYDAAPASPQHWGWETAFAYEATQVYPTAQRCIVKLAQGGTTLAVDWNPSTPGGLFSQLIAHVQAARTLISASGRTPVIWGGTYMQGETDSNDLTMSNAYQANLTALFVALRSSLGVPTLPIAVGRISNSAALTNRAIVRAAQAAVVDADPYLRMIDTDNFVLAGDNVHYLAQGIQVAGARAFRELYAFIDQVVTPWTSWTGPGWFDPDSVTVTGAQVNSLVNKRVGSGDLTGSGTAANRILVAAAKNGRDIVRITRDVTSGNAVPKFVGNPAELLSTFYQGTDKPFTIAIAFTRAVGDTNTAFLIGLSDTVDASNLQQQNIVSRATAASGAQKNNIGTATLAITFGTGQAAGTDHIVVWRQSGNASQLWDTSLTPSFVSGRSATLQSVLTFNSELRPVLFSSEINGASDPTYQNISMNLDFYRCVYDGYKSDADIKALISAWSTDLAIPLV